MNTHTECKEQIKTPHKKKTDRKAIIFDCDGVLVDSEPFSCAVWRPVFARKGVDIGTDYSQIIGKNSIDAINYFLEKFSLKEDANEIALEKEEDYFIFAKGKLKSFPGTVEFIEKVLSLGMKICLASSGSMKKIRFNLEESGLSGYFDTIVSCEEVTRGKPAPDLFLKAASRINVPPENCIVIEDSYYGVKAAKAASMFCIALTTSFPEQKLQEADRIVNNLMEIPVEDITGLKTI